MGRDPYKTPRYVQRDKDRARANNAQKSGKGKLVTRYRSDSHLLTTHDSNTIVNQAVREGAQQRGEQQHAKNEARVANASSSGCASVFVAGIATVGALGALTMRIVGGSRGLF